MIRNTESLVLGLITVSNKVLSIPEKCRNWRVYNSILSLESWELSSGSIEYCDFTSSRIDKEEKKIKNKKIRRREKKDKNVSIKITGEGQVYLDRLGGNQLWD